MGFKCLFNSKKSKNSDSSSGSPSGMAAPINGSRSPSVRLRPRVEELEQVFKKFDVNGDGKISSAELGSFWQNLGHEASEEELQNMITEFDADGDGFIDLQEFVALKHAGGGYEMSLGEPCSMAECRKMISGVDRDGDGMIDFEEFKVMMMVGARWDSMDTLGGTGV
ncbi:CALCIUM-BINDING PROTEIN CML25-RELATED [Salix koriyanagi]|uniref:CALCIUM-BINDING PROTEIN CML25-RELATED n=1 Tax=Salix koriyanagi TaxID=2511006 RepID=A0A9Q0WNF2_9ROSI|nr:CALCIUM-BINDING PROTEIN CML25-RELATED [Salix koriyanagi]